MDVFSGLKGEEDKIREAYTWLQNNIVNSTYDDSDRKYKDNKNADDIFKRGDGTGYDINYAFCDMLREMNIEAKILFVADIDERLFVQKAKYWQFDRSLVAVPNKSGYYDFYSPGAKDLPIGQVPSVNEGAHGLLAGDQNAQFLILPFSSPHSNRIHRYHMLTMDEDLQLSGSISEDYFGHFARSLRLRLSTESEEERTEYIRLKISQLLPNVKVDAVSVKGLEDIVRPVSTKSNIKIASIGRQLGNRLLLTPHELFTTHEMPFHKSDRKYPVYFGHTRKIIETLQIEIPQNWNIEALPSDSVFSNPVGQAAITFKRFGNTLSIQRMFLLTKPFWQASNYADVRRLFRTQQLLEEKMVVLKKVEGN